MQFPNAVIQVFCKAPVPGMVKTRLMPELTDVQAAAMHRQLTLQTLDLVCRIDLCAVQLWCSPDTTHSFFEQIAQDYPVSLKTQPEGDLGIRMDRAITEGLQHYRRAILIGCDCPSFTLADITAALQALDTSYQSVLAPTEDGGYSLIGLKQPTATLFQTIDWSTPKVLSQTRSKLEQEKLSCFELSRQWDVDTYADYLRFSRELEPAPLTTDR